jgi:hypothetical protein
MANVRLSHERCCIQSERVLVRNPIVVCYDSVHRTI